VKKVLSGYFAFAAADRLVVLNAQDPRNSAVFQWPEGMLVTKAAIPPRPLQRSSNSNYVLLRPFGDYGSALVDLQTGQIPLTTRGPAIDRYQDLTAAERTNGDIAIYSGRNTTPSATLTLPPADLGRLRSGLHSPNFEWVALSVENRGAIWNLKSRDGILTFPFSGGEMSSQGVWTSTLEEWVKSPSTGNDEKAYFRASVDFAQKKQLFTLALPPGTSATSVLAGKVDLIVGRGRAQHTILLDVRDAHRDKTLWSREFATQNMFAASPALFMIYSGKSDAAKQIMQGSSELKKKIEADNRHEDFSILEVVETETGRSLGYVSTDFEASGFIRTIRLSGQTMFLEDGFLRISSYSLASGKRLGRQFGHMLATDEQGHVAVQGQPGTVTVLDQDMHSVAEFIHSGNVVYAGFDGTGKRLLCVTASEEFFLHDIP
jgi:hypothetical protein